MITTVDTLRNKGVEFIDVPATYYDALFENEASFMKDSYKTLKDLGILLDVSYKNQATGNKQPALLMQTFTLPMQDRPTFFLEIISRKGSSGFGRKTIKALFEAVERLQEQRKVYTSDH
jgi:4-hydroxyphenylpyruvate dioxygenase